MTTQETGRRTVFARALAAAGQAGPTEAEDYYLWQIIDEGALGASRHVALARELLQHILDNADSPATGLQRARLAAQAIAETRGADAPMIANVLAWVTTDLPEDPAAGRDVLAARLGEFEAGAKRRRQALVAAAQARIGAPTRILAFDYSSTVAAIVQAIHAAGALRHVVVPESRCIAGGRRYLHAFLAAGMTVRYLPDAAMDQAIAESDCLLLGVESLHADGSFLNTVGSRPLAERATAAGRAVFGCTDMFKLDRRSYAGAAPPPRERSFDEVLLTDEDGQQPGTVTTRCPELESVPPTACTALLTEHGPVPPAAIWSLGRELFGPWSPQPE